MVSGARVRTWAAATALAILFTGANAADDDTGTRSGRHGSVTLTVGALTPQWRTAFYVNRGFAAPVIRPYAAACGFSFALRNEGGTAIATRLDAWRAVGADGTEIALKLPESWEAEWERAGVAQPARIAFRWAQFQSENTFEPGDWIMGMATLAAVPQAPFRLLARYRDSGGEHEIVVDQLDCARD